MKPTITKEKPLLLPPGWTQQEVVEKINHWFADEDTPGKYVRTVIDWDHLRLKNPDAHHLAVWSVENGLIGWSEIYRNRNRPGPTIKGYSKPLPLRIRINRTDLFRNIESGVVKLDEVVSSK